MIVDDNADITEAVTDYFITQGIDCKEVNEGHQGLFEIQKLDYDLIFLDIAIPKYSGIDILRELKKQHLRDNCIVILTATDSKMDDFKEYLEVGVKEILKKPIGLDSLEEVTKKYLS